MKTQVSIDKVMCKSLRALGMKPDIEHAVENLYLKQLSSSGPEYVIQRIKELREWYTDCLTNPDGPVKAPDYHKHTSGRRQRPKGVEGILFREKPEFFYDVTGVLLKSITLSSLTAKQRKKWLDGVLGESTSDFSKVPELRPLPSKVIDNMEGSIIKKEAHRAFFDVSDIHGTSIPQRNADPYRVKMERVSKKHASKRPRPDSLFVAWMASLSNAPAIAWSHILENAQNGVYPLGVNQPDFIEYVQRHRQMASEYSLGSDWGIESHGLGPVTFGLNDRVGSISLLQQESGKLRTVANPNRLVQWTTEPLGEVLSEWLYKKKGVYVLNQQSGMRAIQTWLQRGETVYSFDLSSATDTLDFRSFLNVSMRNVHDGHHKILEEALENFDAICSSPWRLDSEAAQKLGLRNPEITWQVGQALGLRPSFPILSLMNYTAGLIAQRRAERRLGTTFDEVQFALVGDDFACTEAMAQDYHDVISAFGGRTNMEKTMCSNRYAEFCSHLITPKRILPLKPKYLLEEGQIVHNLDKFQERQLKVKAPRKIREMWKETSAYHISGVEYYPEGRVNLRPFTERIIAHLDKAKSLHGDEVPYEVSKETLWLLTTEYLRSKPSRIMDYYFDIIEKQSDELAQYAFLQKPVEIGAFKVYDWKDGGYVIPEGDTRRTLRKRFRTIKGLQTNEPGETVYALHRPNLYNPQYRYDADILLEIQKDGLNLTMSVGDKATADTFIKYEELFQNFEEVKQVVSTVLDRYVSDISPEVPISNDDIDLDL